MLNSYLSLSSQLEHDWEDEEKIVFSTNIGLVNKILIIPCSAKKLLGKFKMGWPAFSMNHGGKEERWLVGV